MVNVKLSLKDRRVATAILLALLLLSPSIKAKPLYSVTYVSVQPSEAHLICKYDGVRVMYVKGEQVGGRLAFREIRVPPDGLYCELYVDGAYISSLYVNENMTLFEEQRVVGSRIIKGVVVNEKGEAVNALVIGVRETKVTGGLLGLLVKMILLPIEITSFIMGLMYDLVIAFCLGIASPEAGLAYLEASPLTFLFSLPLSITLSRQPIAIKGGKVALAPSYGKSGFVMEAGTWRLKAFPEVNVGVDLEYRRAIYAILTVGGTEFSDNMTVGFDVAAIWPEISGTVKMTIKRYDTVIEEYEGEYEGYVERVVDTSTPGIYFVEASFTPIVAGGTISVAYERIRWGGTVDVRVDVYRGDEPVSKTITGDEVLVTVRISDPKLVKKLNEVGSKILVSLVVTGPDRSEILNESKSLSALTLSGNTFVMKEKVKVEGEGRWVITATVRGEPYISGSTATTYLEVEKPSLIGLLFLVLVIVIGGATIALARRAWRRRERPTPPPYTREERGWSTYRYERPAAKRRARRPLPVTILAIIDVSLGAVGLLLGLIGIVGLMSPPRGAGLGGIIALGLVLALVVLGSSAGAILLLKGVLLWRGSKWGFWMSIALMVVTAITALMGVYPLLIYSADNLLVILPSSREYLLGAKRRREPPYEVYEL